MQYTHARMTAHGDHKRTNVIKVLLTDPEVSELQRLCRTTGRSTYSELVRYALFGGGLGAQPPVLEQDEAASSGRS